MDRYTEIKKELETPIPRDRVAKRQAGGGRTLDYLEGWYVIDRLNKVFGNGNWGYSIAEGYPKVVHEGEINGKHRVSYIAKVVLEVNFQRPTVPDSERLYSRHTIYEDVGFGNGMDAVDPGKAHELATKEAVTDALKRCAKNLGMSMGLALYDKSQENVDDGETAAPVAVKSTSNGTRSKRKPTAAEIAGLVQSTARVAIGKGIYKTPDDFSKYLEKTYGVSKTKDLTAVQQTELLTTLQTAIS